MLNSNYSEIIFAEKASELYNAMTEIKKVQRSYIVKGKEDHETLKASLSNVIRDANSLIDDGHMIIDGRKVSLEFFLGADYKVIVEVQANSLKIM